MAGLKTRACKKTAAADTARTIEVSSIARRNDERESAASARVPSRLLQTMQRRVKLAAAQLMAGAGQSHAAPATAAAVTKSNCKTAVDFVHVPVFFLHLFDLRLN
jgi:hypothetical protein